jgi:hypothetical protein
LPVLPTAVMRSPVNKTVVSGIAGEPVASITVAWMNAIEVS